MPLRVVHCIQGMGGGGAERQLSYLAPAQAAAGIDTHVVMVDDGINSPRLRSGGATVHLIRSRGNNDPMAFVHLDRLIGTIAPNVVQTWLTRFDIMGGAVARRRGIPWILSERCSAPMYPPTMKNRLRVFLAHGARAIVANSAEGIDYWAGRVPASVKRHVVPNALAIPEIDAAAPADPREGWVPPETPLILFAGRMSGQKNVIVTADAVIRTLRSHRGVALFAGEGPDRAELEVMVAGAGLGDRVRVVDYLPELWSVAKTATVMISASLFEGHPNVVSEAMACSCPLVLSDIAIHRRIARDAALFADAASPAGLSDALANVLTAPDEARHRAERGRTLAEELSLSAVTRSYRSIYESVVAPSRDVSVSS